MQEGGGLAGTSPRGFVTWLLPHGEGADRIDHLSVHRAMGNSVAELAEGARVLWKYAILEQFLG